MKKPPSKLVTIADIDIENSLNPRHSLNTEARDAYAEAMKAGANFPPIVLFGPRDGKYFVADGFHRLEASKKAGIGSILAEIRPGTKFDALRFSVTANDRHGVRMRGADKREAVQLVLRFADHVFKNKPSTVEAVAELCDVHPDMVLMVQMDLELETKAVKRRGEKFCPVCNGRGRNACKHCHECSGAWCENCQGRGVV